MADAARAQTDEVPASEVDSLIAAGAVALDIRDKEEHDADHIAGSLHVSRGKLEMNIMQWLVKWQLFRDYLFLMRKRSQLNYDLKGM